MKTKLGLAAVLAIGAASGAQAVTITDGNVTLKAVIADCDVNGVADSVGNSASCGSNARSNLNNIELADMGDTMLPNVDFYSLGLGGKLAFMATPQITGSGSVIEVTGGSRTNYNESANVYAGNDLNTLFDMANLVTGINNNNESATFSLAGPFTYIGFMDTSEVRSGRDGFDIDAINVSAIPVPAAGVLLLGALGGLGAMRRRNRAA